MTKWWLIAEIFVHNFEKNFIKEYVSKKAKTFLSENEKQNWQVQGSEENIGNVEKKIGTPRKKLFWNS